MSQATPDLAKPAKPADTFLPISGGRKIKDKAATVVFTVCFVLAVIPLVALLFKVIVSGFPAIINVNWWTNSFNLVAPSSMAGGVGHAIYGSLVQALIAAVISIPLGVAAGIMLVEYPDSRLARPTTFMVDVLAGVPSVVAAIFIFGVWISVLKFNLSAFAVALALVLLMLPLIVRSTEEMLKLVPDELREASYALGVPKWKTIVSVVVPTALSGMISGIFLALARVMGETAPVLILVGYTARYNYDVFEGNMASLPLLIYNQLSNPNEAGQYRIWGAALTLIIIIGLANVLATFAAKALAPKTK
ncbi:phosphate ABC transporter, permease protein PstA [Dietzia sp. HMSC21D01]|uniref:Phosphate transport system permease protein PstA n=1 Tax=Dietzia cinnamea TaxID=321318 RepID=A0AAW5QCE9_9ACTN|nr:MULTISPECIES: phosphate ABC transporter permease PstA [Dietzia]PWD95370.1 phosphate ABC transporter permease PtsA [Dietzia maris]AVM64639.1 phosphate ABC transporter permease PtsA [Dietzia sp. oral taxon 368]MBM7229775.1 phosphate ABC transporter permease PstA [Dietzia cinnamea]MCT1712904.1 phosphate ABC transporter permease PstA [Dietzia cinnamea]MCT1864660.1 phosphate ABC transporter permease PstA [Dietzia cinnamea]